MSVSMADIMAVVHRHAPRNFQPRFGMILGSGLSSLADQMTQVVSIPYQAIPGIQTGSVSGHASLLQMGYLNDIPVVCLRGRLHLYEGVAYEPIATLVRIVRNLGCHCFIVTGAAGSLREEVGPGELMMINDHINFQPGNPLVGANDESIGPRFLAMEDAYDHNLREIMIACAERLHIPLQQGVYISTLGPSFETPAEIRAFRMWGADAVGMSCVPEVILARHAGMRVACVAAITNLAAGMQHEKISHTGTLQYGEIAARKLIKLLPEFLKDANESGLAS
ncbi:MAG: purine-nucleoside phosphorylase [Gammaproteobacteria bacterium RIFCSPHIGHO2_12_FULL_43_28]|nr:MAG: purine-nucleoside phosphorylase [Gammaproteobacteria bacterium RIFCSPHIGHO2_12_FULL_43_28]